MSDGAVTTTDSAAALRDPGFCRFHTDHTAVVHWSSDHGWSDHSLEPYAPITMDPGTLVLHYGQSVFEGLKAFRQPDGSAALFRPADHAHRLARSARRLAMAEMPASVFLAACADLVRADDRWLPGEPGQGLYLRPLMIATESALGLRDSRRYRCTFLAYPADPCFGRAFAPISVLTSTDTVRAVRGGVGEAKCSGNYAASLLTRKQANARGYDEVLWLDGLEFRWVEELSGMNVFFVWRADDEPHGVRLTTPPCQGTIMRGVTRDCVITLADDLGIPVAEEPTPIDAVLTGARSGQLVEMFACGTAAVVVAVGRIADGDGDALIGGGQEGAVTARVRHTLMEIQHGIRPDTHGWLRSVRKDLASVHSSTDRQ
ncbi:branched-chain amino acid aminotransferase [Micromonospora sp. NPDC049230]|uniref:branched-chain amino acid aminotransferase n=1 Tax=Micromonospora sp. NPDC049230 TaxID=3155502 RepID=UPI0034029A29